MERGSLNTRLTLSQGEEKLRCRLLSKAEIATKFKLSDEYADKLLKSKVGYIRIQKISGNPGYLRSGGIEEGWCFVFGEGFSCYIDNGYSYYYTSTIQKIDWDKNEFDTINSRYSFELDEIDFRELLSKLDEWKSESRNSTQKQ